MANKLPGAVGLDEMKKILNERFYFDLAGFTMPDQLEGVLGAGLGGEGAKRLVYGTDFPYMRKPVLEELAIELDIGLEKLFPVREEVVRGIYVDNAKKLLDLE